jgi:hypothetical protein
MSKSNKKNRALLKAKIARLTRDGYDLSLNKEELEKRPFGLITYIDKDDKYEKGGFLKEIKEDSFVWHNYDPEVPDQEIKFEDVKQIYTRSPLRLLNRSTKKTNYPVKLGGVTIFYAKDNFDLLRFKNTDRYQQIKKWYFEQKKKNNHNIH